MKALFIGHGYIDVTFVTDYLPTGDEKHVGQDYAVTPGGNAVVAAFTCAKLGKTAGIQPDLLIPIATDWLGEMLMHRCLSAGLNVHPRGVGRSSISLILPKDGKRAIVRCRDAAYTTPFPELYLGDCKAVHVDGHQPDAALHYVKKARDHGILTSLDGGSYDREGVKELLPHIDVAVVSERFCEQLGASPRETLDFLAGKGSRVAAVTLGDKGLVYLENGEFHEIPAIPVPPEKVVDSTGAGDIFHGAYLYHYLSQPEATWEEHFKFARAASALSVQRLGTESSIPTLKEVEALASGK